MPIREIGASITMDASTFKQEMSAVNSNLSGLQSEMKAVTAEFAENANSVDALTAKQKILDQTEAQQAEKVRALNKAYEEQAAATGENSVAADKLRKQLNSARGDYAKATQAADDNRKALTQAKSVTERVANAKEQLKKKLEDLAPRFKDLSTVAKAAGSALGVAGKAAEVTAKGTAALVTGGAAAATALGTLAVSGLGTLVSYAKEAAQAMDADGNLINEKFSTLAENMTKLDAGAAAAKTALGGLLLPALESISGAGADLLNGFAKDLESVSGDTQAMAWVCKKYLIRATNVIRDELPGLVSLGADILEALMEGLEVAGPYMLDTAADLIQMLLDGLVEAAPSMGDGAAEIVTQLLTFILQNAPQLLTAGIQILTSLIAGITDNLPELIPVAIDAIQQLLTALVQNAPELLVGGAKLVLTLVEGLVTHIPDLIAAIPQLIRDFIDGFTNSPELGNLAEIGERIMTKIWDGLKAIWESVKEWFSDKVGALADFLGIDLGGGSGHAGGLNYVPYDNYPAILHRGERVLTAAENASGVYGGGGGNRTVNITVNTRELSRAQSDYLVRRADAELGKAV